VAELMREEHQARIGETIARLREQQGWSQRQLAQWVDLDQSAVSRIEAGRRRVSARELQRFVDAFRVSADALLLGTAGEEAPALALPPHSFPPSDPWPAEPAYAAEPLEPAIDEIDDRPAREHGDIQGAEHGGIADRDDAVDARPAPIPPQPAFRMAVRSRPRDLLGDLPRDLPRDLLFRASQLDDQAGPRSPRPAPSLMRLDGLPAEIEAVVRDWAELRRLAAGDEPALAWSTGHSAEGKQARFAQPVQPAERGALGGDVLYDRVARFWRSELHVAPDDGPLPDLVPLLEDGLGVQVIVARIARFSGREAATREVATPAEAIRTDAASESGERPVCAAFTANGMPFLFVSAARPVVLQRYALAHAFAHLVLGHGDVVDRRIHWSRNNPREAAANDFAEEFLAPVRAVHRWYERRDEPRPEVDTLLELGNAFGISAWAALYRSRAARRLPAKQFAKLSQELRGAEWDLLPWQAFLGGLRDTLTHLTPGECLQPGRFGPPAVLRVPAPMRTWALAAVRSGSLSVERAAACVRVDARELAAQLARSGLE
jgi:transcriptional regulator with XRE-family HTH domain